MEYLWIIAFLLVALPVVVIFMNRRPGGASSGEAQRNHGVTFEEPSSDQPTPRSDTTNPISPEASRRLPPG